MPLPSKPDPSITLVQVPPRGRLWTNGYWNRKFGMPQVELLNKLHAVSGSIFSARRRLHPCNVPVTRNCSHVRGGGPTVRTDGRPDGRHTRAHSEKAAEPRPEQWHFASRSDDLNRLTTLGSCSAALCLFVKPRDMIFKTLFRTQ